MRISDWSSDVCSSDLLRDRGDRPGHAGGAAEVAVEPGDVGIDLGLGRLERGERRAVALDRLAPLVGQALRVELQVRRRGTRSEEHTSELQSLMRISYAVFCLKKKKHLAPHIHPTTILHIIYKQETTTQNENNNNNT